ncbi:MAG TPA: sugar ABC transporter permease, partial [Lachnospiraceae bacterium]|nr:sugar ABC transporter permease [Lachnospiraceae bacterium]
MNRKEKIGNIIVYVILILVSITMLVPFLWMVLTAFKTVGESTQVDPFIIFPSSWRLDNFKTVIATMNFPRLYFNTLLMIVLRILCAVLTATFAGYAFARLEFPGKNIWFGLVLFQMMVPVQLFIIPQYVMVSRLGWTNTIWGLLFPGLVTAFGTFLLRQTYMSLPKE